MGLNDVKRNKDKLFKIFKTEQIFIRPSNGYKTFTGQLLNIENWEEEFDILIKTYGGIDIDQLVLLSSKKNIREENRFIVFNKNDSNYIIDGNTYMIDNKLVKHRIYDNKSFEYVKNFINNYTPDKAFTIDVAKLDNNEYKILEIGSFNCASWYNSNIEKIVNEMNILCIDEYKEYYGMLNN
jgi:hypothetical protein